MFKTSCEFVRTDERRRKKKILIWIIYHEKVRWQLKRTTTTSAKKGSSHRKTYPSSPKTHNQMLSQSELTYELQEKMIDWIHCNERFVLIFHASWNMFKASSSSHPNKSETLLMCGLLRCQISAGWEELRVKYSCAIGTCPVLFWRFGIDRAGTWWSICVKVVYVISCKAWIAFLTSMLSVATSWWSDDTWVSSLSTDVRMIIGFSSLITSSGISSSSSDIVSGMMFWRLALLLLTGLLLRLDVRDFCVFSLSAMRVWRLLKVKGINKRI